MLPSANHPDNPFSSQHFHKDQVIAESRSSFGAMNRKIGINKIYRIFDSPTIWLTSGESGINRVTKLASFGETCLINLIWTFTPLSARIYLPAVKRLKSKGVRVVLLGSCKRDIYIMRLLGLECVLMNQNQFLLEENIPLKKSIGDDMYDAFYAAQAQPFKRMYLASEVKKLYILTYRWPKRLNRKRVLANFEPKVSHANYNRSYIQFEDVCTCFKPKGRGDVGSV